MVTELEKFLAEMNRNVFLREYTFSSNQFRSTSGQEYELADHVVLLPGSILVFQAKERDRDANSSEAAIESWFKREVLKNACKQLADTKRYFESEPVLSLPNQRGDIHELAGPDAPVIQVALYSSGKTRPPLLARTSHRLSSRAGFVHVMHVSDYSEACRILALPEEIAQYFRFREEFLLRNESWDYHEARLVAAFIADEPAPSLDDDAVRELLTDALHDVESFDLGNMLRKYGEKVFYHDGRSARTDYYAILDEFAYMNRAQMRGFRGLFDWALERVDSDVFEPPARMLVPQRDTGFVVFAVPPGEFENRLRALENFTLAAKHDWGLPREVGVGVSRIGEEIEIDWAFVGAPWQEDPEMDRLLADNNPFRPTPKPKLDYRFPARPKDQSA